MEFLTLSNGIKMPLEGFGVFQVPDAAVCKQAVLDAIKTGYRLIDTAAIYMNEEAVGAAIKEAVETGLVKREELFVTTKVWVSDASYEGAKRAFEHSMKKLQLDYLDMLMLHQPYGDVYGAWKAMVELYNEGKHGIFTHPVLTEIGAKYGKTAAQVALKWNAQRGVSIIPKSVHKERMEQNIDIWDFVLSNADMKQIDALDLGHSEIIDHNDPAIVKYILSNKVE